MLFIVIAQQVQSLSLADYPSSLTIRSQDFFNLISYSLGIQKTTLSKTQKKLLYEIAPRDLFQPYQKVMIRVSSENQNSGMNISSSSQVLQFLRNTNDPDIIVQQNQEQMSSVGQHVLVLQIQLSQQEKQIFNKKTRRLAQSQNSQTPYIIYFFFIVIFGIGAALTVKAIAGAQYPKDSLLYAKFIAQIGR